MPALVRLARVVGSCSLIFPLQLVCVAAKERADDGPGSEKCLCHQNLQEEGPAPTNVPPCIPQVAAVERIATSSSERRLEDTGHEISSDDGDEEEHGALLNDHDSVRSVQETARDIVLPITIGLMTAFVAASVPEICRITFIPESLITIVVGALFGLWLREVNGDVGSHVFGVLNATILNLLLLPLIVFESGWSLRVHDFAAEFVYILMFAVCGTLLAWALTLWLLHCTSEYHGLASWRTCAAFAALIVATDPVATLATYASLKVEPLLNIMVFGESMINDAVAIVLFKTLNDNNIMGNPAEGGSKDLSEAFVPIIVGTLWNFIGSLVLGIGTAIVVVLIMRVFDMRHCQQLETLYVVVSPFMLFALCEAVELSGIIANLFFSIAMGIYGRGNLSRKGNLLTSFYIKQTALLADTGVFLLVGLNAAMVDYSGYRLFWWTALFILVARALSTGSVGIAVNGMKAVHGKWLGHGEEKWNLLRPKHLFMMWHAGLRGGIALVLALELGEWVDQEDGEGTHNEIVGATLLIIMAFLALFGSSTELFLKLSGVKTGQDVDVHKLFDAESAGFTVRGIRWIHRKLLFPIFVGDRRRQDLVNEEIKNLELEEVLEESNLNYRHYQKKHRSEQSDDDDGSTADNEASIDSEQEDGEDEDGDESSVSGTLEPPTRSLWMPLL